MLISAPSELSEGFFFFTLGSTCHYLAGYNRLAAIDLCFSVQFPAYQKRLAQFDCRIEQVSQVFLTHHHPDRLGALPYLRRIHPEVQVYGAAALQDMLQNSEVANEIYEQDREMAAKFPDLSDLEPLNKDEFCSLLTLDTILHDGDSETLDGQLRLRATHLPGHTDYSLAYILEPCQYLICDEVCGYFNREKFHAPGADHSLEEMAKSLAKLKSVNIAAIALPDTGVLQGSLVTKYLEEHSADWKDLQREIAEGVEQGMELDEIQALVKENFYSTSQQDPIGNWKRSQSLCAIWPQLLQNLNISSDQSAHK